MTSTIMADINKNEDAGNIYRFNIYTSVEAGLPLEFIPCRRPLQLTEINKVVRASTSLARDDRIIINNGEVN